MTALPKKLVYESTFGDINNTINALISYLEERECDEQCDPNRPMTEGEAEIAAGLDKHFAELEAKERECCEKCDIQLEDDKPSVSCEHCKCHQSPKEEGVFEKSMKILKDVDKKAAERIDESAFTLMQPTEDSSWEEVVDAWELQHDIWSKEDWSERVKPFIRRLLKEVKNETLKRFVSRLRGDLIAMPMDWDEINDIISERLGKELSS